VASVDINPENLAEISAEHPVRTIEADLTDSKKLQELIVDYDLVIGAVPGFMGYDVLKTVITGGKNIVDISFFDEDRHEPFELDELARKKNVTAIIDCGVAPGMSNIILGYYQQRMEVEHFECYVGGLPAVRTWPFQYKAPFSPIDVLEEYTRPARIREKGAVVVKPSLSDPEYLDFSEIGTLEAFNTDGLRTLLKTMPVPNMKEKTLRYPGHIKYMRVLRESGFFDKTPLEINGVSVRPIDFSARLLFPKWKLEKNEREFTVMQINIRGTENGKTVSHTCKLLDRYNDITATSSMARTTGYTCTAVARLLLENQFIRKGICPPEYVGAAEGCFKYIWDYLRERNVRYVLETS
jgi:saccharopine dehydrogenase-like NADP-dependent oxidoreductase